MSDRFQRYGVIGNPDKYEILSALQEVCLWGVTAKVQVCISKTLAERFDLSTFSSCIIVEENEENVVRQSQIIISIGGDGTILWTARLLGHHKRPILGINSGRLGFMANIQEEDISSILNRIQNKDYHIDRRYLLESVDKKGYKNYALNEFLFTKQGTAAMITVNAYYNDYFINRYWADGVLISTPTGSTAYNLSSGGPIVYPKSSVVIVTPINPHTLTTRPLVLPNKGIITIEIEKQEHEVLFSCDGTNFSIEEQPYSIKIHESTRYIDMIEMPEHNFFSTLRNKLMWGKDVREHPIPTI